MGIDRTLLDDDDVDRRLVELPAWRRDGVALRRELRFGSFSEAFAFMTRVAMIAERLDHHPEWTNVYDRLSVRLTTHDRGGVTLLDLAFAHELERLVPPVA